MKIIQSNFIFFKDPAGVSVKDEVNEGRTSGNPEAASQDTSMEQAR